MMPTSADTSVRVKPRSGTAGDLESAWPSALSANPGARIELDLADIAWMDVPGMVFLLSKLLERARNGCKTALTLPNDAGVMRVLRAWNLDSTLERASGNAFESFLSEHSMAAWSWWKKRDRTYNDEVLPDKYFPMQAVLRASRDFDASLAAAWSETWRSAYILTVLNKMLEDHGDRIATHVVHEAIMNGIRHPGAEVLLAASSARTFRNKKTGKPDSRYLTLCIWDDGEGIVSTLRTLSAHYELLTPRKEPLYARIIRLTRVDSSGVETESVLSNQDPIPCGAEDALILLAAIFPGVTSDPNAVRGFAHRDVVKAEPAYALPGMGLFVLATTVAEAFGGKVTIRSGRHRMSIDKEAGGSDDGQALHVKISELSQTDHFLGNQVTIRIPRRALSTE